MNSRIKVDSGKNSQQVNIEKEDKNQKQKS